MKHNIRKNYNTAKEGCIPCNKTENIKNLSTFLFKVSSSKIHFRENSLTRKFLS